MAPSIQCRQLLVWTVPPIAVLLSFLWYKKIRSGYQSDPGDTGPKTGPEQTNESKSPKSEQDEEAETATKATPPRMKRTLSGIESSPIDIIIPPNVKTNQPPPVISDSELDIEIEKVKSMKSPLFNGNSETRKRSALSVQLELAKSNTSPPTPKSSFTCEPKQLLNNKMTQKKSKSKETLVSLSAPKINPGREVLSEIIETAAVENLSKISIDTRNNNEEITLNISGSGSDRQSSERDSANHSPVDVMMASPSLSSISDNQSEGSNDSGKGCSDVATQAGDGSLSGDPQDPPIITYQFAVNKNLVGRLVGVNGNNIKYIKERANVNISVRNYPEVKKTKICSVEGTQKDVDIALKLLRQRFPLKTYSSFTMEQIFVDPPHLYTLLPECAYLNLIEAINNDTIVSHIETPIHLFLHQHTHPSYPILNRLLPYMTETYEKSETPFLPKPISAGSICACFTNGAWFRVSIVSTDTENDTSLIQYMDYGGYSNVANDSLRQIRADFISLPFQAAECILANLRLKLDDKDEIPVEGNNIVADLTRGYPLQTQIVGYTPDNIPLVHVYVVMGHGDIIFLNLALAKAGIADWIENIEVCS